MLLREARIIGIWNSGFCQVKAPARNCIQASVTPSVRMFRCIEPHLACLRSASSRASSHDAALLVACNGSAGGGTHQKRCSKSSSALMKGARRST